MDIEEHGAADRRMEQLIGRLLRGGVLTAAAIVALGGVVFLARHGGEPPALDRFHGEPAALRSVSGLLGGTVALQGRAIIGLGLWVLVLTPVARVALTLVAFARQRNRAFVGITAVVLTALLWALVQG